MAGVTVRNAIERRANLLLIVLFAVAVALPGLAMLAAGGRADVPFLHFTEQRLPAPFPPWERGAMTSGAYGRDFESAFGDALPGRSHLVEGYDAIRYYGFGDTTTPVIVRGRDGWMFASEDRDYRALGGSSPTTAISATWRRSSRSARAGAERTARPMWSSSRPTRARSIPRSSPRTFRSRLARR